MRGTRTSLLGGKPALARDLYAVMVLGGAQHRVDEAGQIKCAQPRNSLRYHPEARGSRQAHSTLS